MPHVPEIRARALSALPAAARCIAAALLFCVAGTVFAREFRGTVVVVPDGDSLVVVDDRRHRQHRVRLAGIDAPEKGQPYAIRSRDHLARLVLAKPVLVRWYKRDDYDRLVGTVFLDGHDVNFEQVRAGHAWWYRFYSYEQPSALARTYERAESDARHERRGLWADDRPTPPWAWRRMPSK